MVFTLLTGIAKPRPSALLALALAFTMPTSEPLALKRPPPELPGLMAASVWISFIFAFSTVTSRLSALMMPLVAVPRSSPSGLPMAMTSSPTVSMSESPSDAGLRLVASILRTARSLRESDPTSFASCSDSSLRITLIVSAPSTTCLQVTI
ncbi:hypothetical protein SDC9_162078 [bioreactor metagenome]|uniref:Uncharacterized protein n=1 Tax=bioreactor metagenome TaxID=1076179 RepID=A0A645FN37_9ZZZZ